MKKIIAAALTLIIVLGLVGCSPMDNVPTLEAVKEYSAEDFNEHFKGVNREGLIEVWGEPAESLNEENADMWDIDDISTVLIYWKDNSKYRYATIRPVEYHGEYAEDKSVLIISKDSDLETVDIAEYFSNGNIILVTNWALAQQVQNTISPTVQTSFSASDAVILFYKQESGASGTSVIEGNSSDWDAEIDKMIATAKEKQTNE